MLPFPTPTADLEVCIFQKSSHVISELITYIFQHSHVTSELKIYIFQLSHVTSELKTYQYISKLLWHIKIRK